MRQSLKLHLSELTWKRGRNLRVNTDSSNEMQSSFSQVERVWEMIDCWFDYLVTGRPKQTFISIVLMSSILAILSQMYPNLCCNANDTY